MLRQRSWGGKQRYQARETKPSWTFQLDLSPVECSCEWPTHMSCGAHTSFSQVLPKLRPTETWKINYCCLKATSFWGGWLCNNTKANMLKKSWFFWTVVLEKTLESPLDCKEIQPVHFKGDQSRDSLEGLMLKLKLQYFGHLMRRVDSLEKTLMLEGIRGRRRRGQQRMRWHHWLDGHEFEWTPGIGDGQGGLACCSSWGHKESDTTEWLNWTELISSWKNTQKNIIEKQLWSWDLTISYFFLIIERSFCYKGKFSKQFSLLTESHNLIFSLHRYVYCPFPLKTQLYC